MLSEPVVSADETRIGYITSGTLGKYRIFIDGIPGPEYDGIIQNGPTFRENGELEYLAVKSGGLYRVKHIF